MRSLSLVALLALSAQAAVSQQTPVVGRTTTLTLEEAISIAQRNNPALHQVQNNVRTQDAQVRTAYGQLLPTAGANLRSTFNQGGTQYVNGVALPGGSGDYYQSGGGQSSVAQPSGGEKTRLRYDPATGDFK